MADQERTRLAAELHDGLCQELTGLSLMLSGLARRAHRESPALAAEIDKVSEVANSTIVSARDIARGMLPMELRMGDFKSVLIRLARSTRKSRNVRVRIRMVGSPDHHPVGHVAEHLYRIAQESVANSIKHGQAKSIAVSVVSRPKKLTLSVSDDGRGFQPECSTRGMGLRIMRYRMRTLGGRLEVRRARGGGTRVICVVPAGQLLALSGTGE
jgi:signal transduction histidine kinase